MCKDINVSSKDDAKRRQEVKEFIERVFGKNSSNDEKFVDNISAKWEDIKNREVIGGGC